MVFLFLASSTISGNIIRNIIILHKKKFK
ncbi:MAG: hypothetical protein IKK79_09360 [Spirochaetaceae bacterium]|nr:hypothetical protein [Spirochaetaceae bacterium]